MLLSHLLQVHLLAMLSTLVPKCPALRLPLSTTAATPSKATAVLKSAYTSKALVERLAKPLTLAIRPRADSSSADCAQLAKDPTSNPRAYAIACAHEFGTQLPPYTHTIGAEGSSPTTTVIMHTTTTTTTSRWTSRPRTSKPKPTSPSVSSVTTSYVTVKLPLPTASQQVKGDSSGGGSSSHGSAIGASIGVIAVFAAVGGGLYFTRKKWLPHARELWRKHDPRRNSRDHYSADTFQTERKSDATDETYVHDGSAKDRGETGDVEISGELDRYGQSEMALPGSGFGKNKRYYSVTNPDQSRTVPPRVGSSQQSFQGRHDEGFMSQRNLEFPSAAGHDEFEESRGMDPVSPGIASSTGRAGDDRSFADDPDYGNATPGYANEPGGEDGCGHHDEGGAALRYNQGTGARGAYDDQEDHEGTARYSRGTDASGQYEDDEKEAYGEHSAALRDSGAFSDGQPGRPGSHQPDQGAMRDDGPETDAEDFDDRAPAMYGSHNEHEAAESEYGDQSAGLQDQSSPRPASLQSYEDYQCTPRPGGLQGQMDESLSPGAATRASVFSSTTSNFSDDVPRAPTCSEFPQHRRFEPKGGYDDRQDLPSQPGRPMSGQSECEGAGDEEMASPSEQQTPRAETHGGGMHSTIMSPPSKDTHYSTFGQHPLAQG